MYSITNDKNVEEVDQIKNLILTVFTLVREANFRVLRLLPYYVQLIGELILYKGTLAEMKIGNAKTILI